MVSWTRKLLQSWEFSDQNVAQAQIEVRMGHQRRAVEAVEEALDDISVQKRAGIGGGRTPHYDKV